MNTLLLSVIQKLWNYCNVLRDDGMSYGGYVKQSRVITGDLGSDGEKSAS